MFHRVYLRWVLVCLLSGFVVFNCSKEKNPAGPDGAEDQFVLVHFEGDSTEIEFSNLNIFDVTTLAKVHAGENDAVWLNAFVGTDLIPMYYDKDDNPFDARNLYAYRNEGDGRSVRSAHSRGNSSAARVSLD